jgi:PIN domain nuclease of toxin-antitoxin system
VSSRLLLDTHTFIWWAAHDPRLSAPARAAIAARDATVYLSVVTPWEIAIKHAIGRLELSEPPRTLVYAQIARNGYLPLDISLEHVLAVGELPAHHRDPFDRLLIAQGRAEGLTIVSGDAAFAPYDLPVLW